jgi:hypothetical protein
MQQILRRRKIRARLLSGFSPKLIVWISIFTLQAYSTWQFMYNTCSEKLHFLCVRVRCSTITSSPNLCF